MENETSRLAKTIVVLTCAVPAIATIAFGAVDSWTIGLLSVVIAIIVLLWLADAWRSGEFRYNTNRLQIPILVLLAIGIIQLLPVASRNDASALLNVPVAHALSIDPYATRLFVIRLAICFVFFAAALVYVPGGTRPRKIAIAAVVFGALLAFFGILQRLAIPEAIYGLRSTPQAISFGPFVNQHHFAALMEMISGIALGLLFGSGVGRERKLFLAIAAGIMGMAIVFTGSRGGVISYLGVIAFAAVASFARRTSATDDEHDTRTRRNRNLLVITAAGGLIILVLGSVLFLGGETSLLRGIGLQASQSDLTSGRAHFWNIGWTIFLAHPIIGSGFDSFGAAFSRYDTWTGMYRVEQAHNDYLQTLADGGILAFICVAAFVFILIRKGISAMGSRTNNLDRSIATGALAGCLGILIHSFFDFPLRTTANAFFFLLLVVLAVGHSAARKGRREATAP